MARGSEVDVLEWGAPPKVKQESHLSGIAEKLAEKPGEWALVSRSGNGTGLKNHGCDVRTRKEGDDSLVYARFVGTDEAKKIAEKNDKEAEKA